MAEPSVPTRHVSPAQVAELLDITVPDVMALLHEGLLRGARVGGAGQWRVEEKSVAEYLAEQREEARRIALWRQSNTASFPELWGTTERRD